MGGWMNYELRYSDRALEQLKALRAYDKASVLDKIEQMLTTEPTRTGKTAIKRLQQPAPTRYRLRAGEFRIFYNVEGNVVRVVEILSKEDSIEFLRRHP
jgi:mRNA-degrading endonuclease RelE of RelBE toxin-antitoxin system